MPFFTTLRHITLTLCTILSINCSAITWNKGIVVLDMTERNEENESSGDYSRQLYSAQYMCDIAGYPYATVSDLSEAMEKGSIILFSNNILAKSFTQEEYDKLIQWVTDGGIILSPAIRSTSTTSRPYLAELFGIDTSRLSGSSKDRTLIEWNPDFYSDAELVYFDEPEERTTSIGSIRTYNIPADDADVLAHFNNGDIAVSRHQLCKGATYLVGILWRDVVQRNQLNKDPSGASRQYNNGFEPSADVWALLLRSITAANSEVSAWKFTVPNGFTQLLVPTHDCDSRTAYDAMHFMGDYEKSLKMKGHYFLTTHYFSDKKVFGYSYLSDFYNEETLPKAIDLLDNGHTIGSHSICHFPDFNKTRNMDVVTPEEYAQRATCEDGVSRGASTWAEVVLSKMILEEDLNNNVRSFRSGHLCVNPDIPEALEMGDYEFASCYTAGDLLSQFPFYTRKRNDWSGDVTDILQMPLHISDVYNNKTEGGINDDNWETHPAVDQWEEAMRKLRGNYASAILLIHPNREWKMTLQKQLVERLDLSTVGCYNFEDYGDFWKTRLSIPFEYAYDTQSGVLTIITDIRKAEQHRITFAVESKAQIGKAILLDKDSGDSMECDLVEIAPGRYLTRQAPPVSAVETLNISSSDSSLSLLLNGDSLNVNASGLIKLYNLTGACVLSTTLAADSGTINISHLPKGVYIVTSSQKGSSKFAKR